MKLKELSYILFIATITLSSCDGFEISNNGDLDGMWHLVQVDSLRVNCLPQDYTNEGIFWSIQDKLMMVEDKQDRYQSLFLRFSREGNVFCTSEPYINHHREKPEEKTEDVSLLKPYGLNKVNETFQIEKINSEELILQSDILSLSFVRY